MIIHPITYCDPSRLFSRFANQPWALWLDSAQVHTHYGRYSFIAIDPFATLVSQNGCIRFSAHRFQGNPFHFLEQKIQQYHVLNTKSIVPFAGGAAGYFGYELNQHLEAVRSASINDALFPDMALGFYDLVIGFDHIAQQAWICSTGLPERSSTARQQRAEKRLKWLREALTGLHQSYRFKEGSSEKVKAVARSNFTYAEYLQAVHKTIEYIRAGDIFEANIAQRFCCHLSKHSAPFVLYQRLRQENPAPFAGYFNLGKQQIASASPERFLYLQKGQVETRPIKGTRPRGKTVSEDRQLADELMRSSKDRAENVMIVDLMRNDLSKVCKNHSVNVSTLCGLETYANVHHLVSVVTGTLQADKTAIDLLTAAFPGGSITGAPKIRAMDIIAGIEPHVRGPYCGSMGYITFNGDMNTSIMIRTMLINQSTVLFHSGGAITIESNPEQEYNETLAKIAPLQKILLNE